MSLFELTVFLIMAFPVVVTATIVRTLITNFIFKFTFLDSKVQMEMTARTKERDARASASRNTTVHNISSL